MKTGKIMTLAILISILAAAVMWALPALAAPAPESDFDFNASTGAITNYRGSGGVVEIPASIGGVPVTAIGNSAFYQKNSVTSVIIPFGVTRIDSSAFLNCSGLTDITIPDSVTTIGANAFQGCSNLAGIAIPEGVAIINDYTFRNCSKLAEVSLPNGLTHINSRAFWNCTSLESLIIPVTVTSIGEGVFMGCSNLLSIAIPNSVTSISGNAFNSCGRLESVTLPDNLTGIEGWAFSFCYELKNINIPDSVTSIGSGAFNNCRSLTGINLPNGLTGIPERLFSQCSGLVSITIPDSVTSIGNSVFFYCTGLTSISIPDGVTSIGDNAFEGCTSLTSINIPTGVTAINPATFKGCSKLASLNIPNWITSIGANAFQGCSGLISINIPDSITVINPSTFLGCSKLTNLVIPDTVTSIGAGAFQDCSSLMSINIPDSITVICPSTFQGCSKLASLIIPDTVADIGASAFQGCSKLTSINIPESITVINPFTFQGCTSLAGIDLPNAVTSIGASAFEGCSNLSSIVIPNGVTQISNLTFSSCSKLTSVTLPDTIIGIGDHAFRECTSLESITIPDHVTSIGSCAFYFCTSLRSINIPDGITTIEDAAFRTCQSLTGIVLPDELTRIGNEAFYGCLSLTSLAIPDTVTSIGSHAFYNCRNLAGITIPDGVTRLDQYTFYYCTSMTSIVLPSGLTTIEQRAFQSCSSLIKAQFTGNAPTMSNDVFTGTAAGFKVYYFRDKTGFPGETGGMWNGYNAFPLVSVTYHANDSSEGSVPVDGTLYEQGQIVTVQDKTGGLTHTDPDYVFIGWNTAPDGSGSHYNAGDTFAVAGGSNKTLYAQWRTVHTVLWMSQDGSTILEEDESAPYGIRPEFNAALPSKVSTPAYAYTFVGWATSPDQAVGTAEGSLPPVTGNATYYAAFSQTLRSYTVTFNSNGGSAVSSQGVSYNTTADEPDNPTKPGHTFAGWYSDIGLTSAYDFETSTTDYLTLYAKWTVNTYTVSFNSNGGSTVLSQDISYNSTAEEPDAPLLTGHTFAGWYSDIGLTSAYDFDTPISDYLTLYAKWTVNTYTVSFNSNGGSAVSSQGITYNNTADEPDAPLLTGHTFAGWYSDIGLTSPYDFLTPVTHGLILYAKWTPNDYTLSFDAQGGISSESSRIVTYNTPVGTLPDASKTGYTLAGWYTGVNGSGTAYTAETAYQTADNLTLYAKWTPNTYTIFFDVQGSDTIGPKNVTYHEQIGVLPFPYKSGYTFGGWYTGENGSGTGYNDGTMIYEVADNLTLYAKWRPKTYNLPIDSQGGNCPVLTMEVTYDAPMGDLPIATKAGYALGGWYAGTNGTGIKFTTEYIFKFTFELTLFAHWTPNSYTLTFDAQGGSSSESSRVVSYNSPVGALPDTSKAGYTLAGWYTEINGSGTEYTAETAYQTADNLTLYAKWTPNTYTLSFDAQGGSCSEMTRDVTFGDVVGSLPEASKNGYTLEGWYTGENGAGTKYTIETAYQTADNLTLYANWSANTYFFNFDSQSGSDVLPIPVTYNAQIGVLPSASKPGFALAGWYTETDGGGTEYTAETIYETAGNMTLYAFWAETYSITYSLNEGTGTAPVEADKIEGETFSVAGPVGMTAPSGKRFKAWNTAPDGEGDSFLPGVTVTMSRGNLLLYAIWENIPVSPASPGPIASVNNASGQTAQLAVKVNAGTGVASVDAGSQMLTSGETVITIPSISNINTYSAGIPISELSTSDGQHTLTLNTVAGSITVPSNMLTGVPGVGGNKAEIVIGQGDKDKLPDDVRLAISDKPLISLTLAIDGKQTDWSNPHVPVKVSIPYTPSAAEMNDPESIVIWYIDGSGQVVTVPNGHYDPLTKRVTFYTTHFSDYAVAYHRVSFKDIPSGVWYHEAVSFIAARRITSGTGGGNYSPEAKLTRGEAIVMIMRALGIAPEQRPTDNFKDAGDTYYTGYLAAAKHLGISAGIGGNLFAPGKAITHQEMFTFLYNALKVTGQLPAERDYPNAPSLSALADVGQIDFWAKETMTLLVKTGNISGSTEKLMPHSITTRAEFAQVLYKLLIFND